MCSATIYWANIGRLVYGASNEELYKLTGPKNKENFTMKWNCREIIAGGQKDVDIMGPLTGTWEEKVVEDADGYWSVVRKQIEEKA